MVKSLQRETQRAAWGEEPETPRCERDRVAYFPEVEQSAEIMRTELTRTCWLPPMVPDLSEPLPPVAVVLLPEELLEPDVDDPEPPVVVELESEPLPGRRVESIVPVTSIRWPTWLFSSVSRPSRTYVLPIADVAALPLLSLPVAPVPPLVLPVVADPPEPEVDPVVAPELEAVAPEDPGKPLPIAFVRM